jgi:hypothetical protein
MKGEIAIAVRSLFEKELRQRMPGFHLVEAQEIPPGSRVYRWSAELRLSFFLMLFISPKGNAFTVECAWSESDEWPAYVLSDSPDDAPRQGAVRFRVGQLWGADDFWWRPRIAQTPEEQVRPAVQDAVERIERYVVPYFEKVESGPRGHEKTVNS